MEAATATPSADLSVLAGQTAAPTDARLLAIRYRQGGRTHYSIQLPVSEIISYLPKPDPEKPFPGNRNVDPKHGNEFGTYLRGNGNWASPAIMVRTPAEHLQEIEAAEPSAPQGIQPVVISIPKKVTDEIAALVILDGQHRVFGIYNSYVTLQSEIRENEYALQTAEKNGSEPALIETLKKKAARLSDELKRFTGECISIDLAIVDDAGAKQIFVDIADNAKGISRDFRVILDQRQVVNRVATWLSEKHPMLRGRVWEGHARSSMPKQGEYLWGARHIADAVRATFVGATGRIGKEIEKQLSTREEMSRRRASAFFDDLFASSLVLSAVVYDGLEEWRLREQVSKDPLVLGERFSMLYSGPMVRVLAGVWHELTEPSKPKKKGEPTPDALSRDEVVEYFQKLDVLMELKQPMEEKSFWVKGCPPAFAVGGTAPNSRTGSLRQLERTLIEWGREKLPKLPDDVQDQIAKRPGEIKKLHP